jgi:hypothetical protein
MRAIRHPAIERSACGLAVYGFNPWDGCHTCPRQFVTACEFLFGVGSASCLARPSWLSCPAFSPPRNAPQRRAEGGTDGLTFPPSRPYGSSLCRHLRMLMPRLARIIPRHLPRREPGLPRAPEILTPDLPSTHIAAFVERHFHQSPLAARIASRAAHHVRSASAHECSCCHGGYSVNSGPAC